MCPRGSLSLTHCFGLHPSPLRDEKWEDARMRGLEARLLVWRSAQSLGSSPVHLERQRLGLASQFRGPVGAVSGREWTLNPSYISNHPNSCSKGEEFAKVTHNLIFTLSAPRSLYPCSTEPGTLSLSTWAGEVAAGTRA